MRIKGSKLCAIAASVLMLSSAFLSAQSTPSGADEDGVRWADRFPGKSAAEKINAAIANCGPYTGAPGNGCLVIIPSILSCGEPNQAPDHVLLWDLRGCAQSQGLRFNVPKSASGRVRSKILLQDNFTLRPAGTAPETSSASLYVNALPDSADTTKGTVAAVNGSINTNTLNGNFDGVLVGIEGEAFAALTRPGPYTVRDMRGGTFNTLVGKGVKAMNVTSLYAQAPQTSAAGEVLNAYSFRAEAPKIGTKTNLAGLFNGDVQIDTKLKVGGSIAVGGGQPVSKLLLAHQQIAFDEVKPQGCSEKPLTVPGATPSGAVSASPAGTLNSDLLFWSARVGALDKVIVRLCNLGTTPAPSSRTDWNIMVVE